jgi:hypothetical protein
MAEKTTGDSGRRRAERWRALLAIAFPAGAILALAGWLSYGKWWGRSAWEQLVALNRAHLLAPEENAATVYDRLVADPNWWVAALKPLTSPESVTPGPSGPDTHPDVIPEQIAASIMAILREAARYDKCYFTITEFSRRQDRIGMIRRGAQIMAFAARADGRAGRTQEAIEKLEAVVRVARHLAQQPLMSDFLAALGIEAFAWRAVGDLLVNADVTEEQLRTMEALVPSLKDSWRKEAALAMKVEGLLVQVGMEESSVQEKLAYLWHGAGSASAYDNENIHGLYLRLLADRRGTRLLIALRRYKSRTGSWPRRLDDIRANVPKEALLDPYSRGRPFVYRATGESPLLYSTGPNQLDQLGQGDDWRLWPRGTIPAGKPQEKTKQVGNR